LGLRWILTTFIVSDTFILKKWSDTLETRVVFTSFSENDYSHPVEGRFVQFFADFVV